MTINIAELRKLSNDSQHSRRWSAKHDQGRISYRIAPIAETRVVFLQEFSRSTTTVLENFVKLVITISTFLGHIFRYCTRDVEGIFVSFTSLHR